MAEDIGKLRITGVLEAKLAVINSFDDSHTSDITLAIFERGLESKISHKVSARALLLHEEDEPDSIILDEAVITLSLNEQTYLSIGRMYLPFGVFESNMISGPLTLEIAETGEPAVLIGFESSKFYGSAYIFNGDTNTGDGAGNLDDDAIEHFGTSLGCTVESNRFSFNLGIDYNSNAVDSDALQGLAVKLSRYVSGIAIHATAISGPLSIIAEHIQIDQIDEIIFNGDSANITASNIEFAYAFNWGTTAIGYQSTEEALALELPKNSILITTSHDIDDAASIAFEYGNAHRLW